MTKLLYFGILYFFNNMAPDILTAFAPSAISKVSTLRRPALARRHIKCADIMFSKEKDSAFIHYPAAPVSAAKVSRRRAWRILFFRRRMISASSEKSALLCFLAFGLARRLPRPNRHKRKQIGANGAIGIGFVIPILVAIIIAN
jgi:hypothetical protein